MLKKVFARNPFRVFYIVFAYIIIFSLWWGYLLYAKNETAYREKLELNLQAFQSQHPGEDYSKTADFEMLLNKHNRQRIMIVTEGGVFFVLLLAGLMLVRRVFMREIELAAQQRNFLLSITHELKSPLSSIKASLQTFKRRKLEAEQTDKLVNNSLSDLDRLQALVDNILFAAKIERSEPDFSNESVNVSEVLEQTVEKNSGNKKHIKIQTDIEHDVYLKVDLLGFTSVAINLIENAIKYSPEHSIILVKLKRMPSGGTELWVCDQGYGIPVEERERVFEKFYRIGNEDTRRAKGTGLGLYIVKRFVEIYNGRIVVEDNQPVGTVFHLSLPEN